MATHYRKTNGEGVQVEGTRIAVVMVGLPARGKSLIAQKGITSIHSRYQAQAEADRRIPIQSSATWLGFPFRRRPSMLAPTAVQTLPNPQPTSSTHPTRMASG